MNTQILSSLLLIVEAGSSINLECLYRTDIHSFEYLQCAIAYFAVFFFQSV